MCPTQELPKTPVTESAVEKKALTPSQVPPSSKVSSVPNQQRPTLLSTSKKASNQPTAEGSPYITPDYNKSYQIQQKGWLKEDSSDQSKTGQKLSYLEKQNLKDLMMNMSRVLLMTQIYKVTHQIVQNKISSVSLDMIETINKFGRLVLANREDIIFLNGYQEKVTGGPLQKLVNTFKAFKVSSFEFEKGITPQEITSFFTLMASQKRQKSTEDIKDQLQKAGIIHIRPVFLQYIEVGDVPRDVARPKNLVAKPGQRAAKNVKEEQLITDFLKGKITELPKKLNTFLLNHPKLAAMVIVKMLDEYEDQNLDSFSAFQAYVQSMSHYMARVSRLIKNPDAAAKTLEKLEKHLVVRLKSLKKDRKFITETKRQIKDALSWVQIEQMVAHYEKAKNNLSEKEKEIIEAIEKRKVPSAKELKERLEQVGFFQSKLALYINKA